MKKFRMLILIVLALFCLAACTKNENHDTNISVTPDATAAPTDTAAQDSKQDNTPEVPVIEAEPVDLKEIFAAYINYLDDYASENREETTDLHFSMGFVDEDGFPELLVVKGESEDDRFEILKYKDESVVSAGSYGSNGRICYLTGANCIVETVYGEDMVERTTVYHIEDCAPVVDTLFCYDIANESYTVNGVTVDADTFGMEMDMLFVDSIPMVIDYETTFGYYPNLVNDYSEDVFEQIYGKLIDGKIPVVYRSEEMKGLKGTWSVVFLDYICGNENWYYNRNYMDLTNCSVTSELSVDEEYASFWMDIYDSDYEPVDFMTIYGAPMLYSPNDISDGLCTGWNVQLKTEDDNTDYYLTMEDEDTVVMVGLTYDGNSLKSSFTAKLKREYNESSYLMVYSKLIRNAAGDSDGLLAFNGRDMIAISCDDAELIDQYGLPEDLNGYDYEIVEEMDAEPYTVYIDEDCDCFLIRDMKEVGVGYEEFADRASKSFGFPVELYYDYDEIMAIADDYPNLEQEEIAKNHLTPAAIKERYEG